MINLCISDKDKVKNSLRVYEEIVLSIMINFKEKRFPWLNTLKESHFLTYECKKMFNVISDNRELNEYDIVAEIERDSYLNEYNVTSFLENTHSQGNMNRFEDNAFNKIVQHKRYRDIRKKFFEIDIFEPSEESIQNLYSDVVSLDNDLTYLSAIQCFGMIAKDFQNNTEAKPLYTGVKEYDEMIGGFLEGMHVISGRAGTGKSSFAAAKLFSFCDKNKNKANIFFSAEMGERAITKRVVSYLSNIDNTVIKSKNLTKKDVDKFQFASGKAPKNCFFVPCSRLCTNEAEQMIEKICKENDLEPGMIVFDYIQKMTPNDKSGRSENEDFVKLSSDLTEFSKKYFSIVISNLNKPREGREYSCPSVYDIKGGSMLEFDATSMMMLWKPSADSNFVYSRFIKNRDGENGAEATWKFNGALGKFQFFNYGIQKEENSNSTFNNDLERFA